MNRFTDGTREKLRRPERERVSVLIIVTSLLLCLSINNQSLWIDEAVMAYFAAHTGLANLTTTVASLRTSDPQMPLYILYLWGWAKLFGTSEYALRSANVPFAVLLVAAMGWTSWRVLGRPVLWVVVCLSPFVWFYMNEARPYIAIIGCSAVSTGALMAYCADQKTYGECAPWLCLSALLIACSLQMLSVFLAPALVVFAVLSMNEKRLGWDRVSRDWGPALMVHVPLFSALGIYFLWTLTVGAGGMRESPGPGNLVFTFYEFFGFSGLGPPRNILRSEQNLQTFIPYWQWLFLGVVSAAAVSICSVCQIIRGQTDYLSKLAVALLVGVCLFAMASAVAEFRFWGRHLAVFFPLFSFMLISTIGGLAIPKSWRLIGRCTVILLACTWAISNARLSVLPRYQKDDYRFAAGTALDVANRSNATILWAANGVAARYYGLEFDEPLERVQWRGSGKAVLAANWSKHQIGEYLNSANAPVVLVLSTKADLFDTAENWSTAVQRLKPLKIAAPNTFNIYLFGNAGADSKLARIFGAF